MSRSRSRVFRACIVASALLTMASCGDSGRHRWDEGLEVSISGALNPGDSLALESALRVGFRIEVLHSEAPIRLRRGVLRPSGARLLFASDDRDSIARTLLAMRGGPDTCSFTDPIDPSYKWVITIVDSARGRYARFVVLGPDSVGHSWRVTPGSGAGMWSAPYLRGMLLAR